MEQKVLSVGIAGFGVVGQRRRTYIDRHPNLKTVAVCDQKFSGAGTFEDGLRYYPTYQELLQEDFDILFVCLPNYMAPDVTIAGLEGGMHVFCEKPPGRTVQDIENVINCEKRHPHLKLKYGLNHRYHDSILDALRIVQEEELGKVVNLNGVYGKSKIISFQSDWRTERARSGGGILLDQGIHMVDLMRLFAGEFTQIHSFISNDFWHHDVEDNAYALMRTDSGVVGLLHSSATLWRHRFRLEITLERGSIMLLGILSGSKSYGAETLTVAYATEDDAGDPREMTLRYNQDNSWRDEIAEFADAVLMDLPIINGSSEDALRTMQLVYQIYCADSVWREKYQLSS